jgi:hypothetical protein
MENSCRRVISNRKVMPEDLKQSNLKLKYGDISARIGRISWLWSGKTKYVHMLNNMQSTSIK